MPLAHLSIGTSTNRISLLSERGGFMLDDWQVGGTEYGAIFQESQLADFRQMAAYRDVTTFDTFALKLWANSQDTAARQIQDLRTIVRLCLDFWTTTYQTSVVYLSARASCETFLQATGNAVMDGLSLIVERGPWLENAPGTGTAVEIGVTQTYDGRTVGNVDSTGTEELSSDALTVFAANKHNVAQLTDVWYYDTSAGAWSANLMDAAVPFAFMPPAALQVGDFVIFGIDSAVADYGPFSSLVFDIGTALGVGGGITIQWRYSDGAPDPLNWNPLTVHDNTNAAGAMTGDAFDTTGINSVHWEHPPLWLVTNPNPGVALGVTAYWVCAYVTAVPGAAPTPPIQVNRDIYTVTWPYTEFPASEVDGDMPALLRLSVDNRAAQDGAGTTTDLWCQRVLAGLRSHDRGENFTSFVNISDTQNNADVQITLGGGMGAWGVYLYAPTGRSSLYTAAGIDAMAVRVYIKLTSDFYGRFHAFVRGKQLNGTVGTIGVRLAYAALGSFIPETRTPTKQFLNINDDQLLDMGEIVLGPAADTYPLDVSQTYVYVEVEHTDALGAQAYFYDLILIPVDEWAVDSEDMLKNTGALGYTNDYWSHLEVDGIRNQRHLLSYLIGTASDKIARYWRPITNGIPILQTSKKQRLWYLFARYDDYADADDLRADSEICSTIQIWKNQRYSTLRGDQ